MLFQQQIRSIPKVNANFWSFSIGGKVSRPLILSYADLLALPAQTLRAAITCAAPNGDHPLIGEAIWQGAPLADLLNELDIAPDAQYARITAADGYSTVLPFAALAQAFLVTVMDGAPLPPEHGYPARLIAPGLHGYKMPKWIERIELTASPDGGFWETRGGSIDGTARVAAAIHSCDQSTTDTVTFSGVASAGGKPLSAVQISIDGGGWMPVTFTPADRHALTHWQVKWTPPGTGDYHVTVRASDGSADAQHSLVVRIR